jgi:uncharacterized protein (TIGR02588 family)
MKKPQKNWVEWAIFAISLVVILSTAGALIYEKVSLGNEPADPRIVLGPPEARGDYFAVPVMVVNRGDETAQGVHIQVRLRFSGGEEEESSFDLQYLPRHSTRKAWVTFRHDPRQGKLEPRVLGYEKP